MENRSPSPLQMSLHLYTLHQPKPSASPSLTVPNFNATSATPKSSKPSLKLNMGKPPPARSLASISNTIPNFNNTGPFSPGLFTSKRIWVKQPNGTATTVMVGQPDIIDDLKTNIIHKFPNSLGKVFDAADLIIKIDLHARKAPGSSQPHTTTHPPHKKAHMWSVTPDSSKPGSSPVSLTFEKTLPNVPPQNANLRQNNSNYSLMTLEPDQNVWNILELYFPGGMNMNEALIIETPVLEESFYDNNGPMRRPENQYNTSSLYHSSESPVHYPPQQYSHYHSNLNPQSIPPYRSITPNSATSHQGYFQPKPQYMAPNNAFKDRSLSPSNPKGLQALPLPLGINLHRRSQSNPPQSPVSSLNVSNNTQNNGSNLISGPSSAKPSNNQAVLLLPKNFSLSSNSNGSSHEKKRLSLDENFVKKNRDTLTSPVNKNLSNLKTPEELLEHKEYLQTPFPKISIDSDKLATSNVSTDSPSNSTETALPSTTTDPINTDSLSKSPVPPHKPTANSGAEKPAEKSNGSKIDTTKISRQPSGSKKVQGTTETVLPSISVLVVEDNAINQAILGAFLRKHKIHYEIAKNGAEAITKWRKGGFHLVLMDIQLPVKSGIDATKEIRHLERINRIGVFAENEVSGMKGPDELSNEERLDMNVFRSPVIIVALTASSNSSVDRSNALRAGCNDYLIKPVNLVWLQNKITEWGCMQALIDFDGWKTKRSNFNGSSAKILAQKTKNRSRSSSQTKVI